MKVEGVRGNDWKCLLWQLLDGSYFTIHVKLDSPHGGFIFEEINCRLESIMKEGIDIHIRGIKNPRIIPYTAIMSIET